jgi:AraC family transcriptional regulator, regulatory protein of adaptative response / methylated-DNA-[protein]-cysteine methyltransferase
MTIKPIILKMTKNDCSSLEHASYGIHITDLGTCLVVVCKFGLLSLTFHDNDYSKQLDILKKEFPSAKFTENKEGTGGICANLFSEDILTCKLALRGTDFQYSVWSSLMNIPSGAVISYETIAKHIGSPNAHRAVGTAVGANPIAVVIPCHRVVQKNGALGQYRWGIERKEALLRSELGLAKQEQLTLTPEMSL